MFSETAKAEGCLEFERWENPDSRHGWHIWVYRYETPFGTCYTIMDGGAGDIKTCDDRDEALAYAERECLTASYWKAIADKKFQGTLQSYAEAIQ